MTFTKQIEGDFTSNTIMSTKRTFTYYVNKGRGGVICHMLTDVDIKMRGGGGGGGGVV